jgi:cell wall-associated NlpC family hydrolase
MELRWGRALPLLVVVGALAAAGTPSVASVEVIIGGPTPTPAPVAAGAKRHHPKHAAAAQPALPGAQSARGAAISAAIVSYALRFIGMPYVWGGASPGGFDCSGYTWYAYRMLGYAIPRTADMQYVAGRPVSSPLPGDLVFFQTYDYGASHVGIYLGSGRFVNSIAGNVHISSFGDGYFASRYIGARRFAALE